VSCSAGASGGVEPYAFHWNRSTTDGGSTYFAFCSPGGQYSVSVTVTDAAGTTASAGPQFVRC
jgi:hypothetical protein